MTLTVLVVAAGFVAPAQDRVETTAAMATFQRLAAAIPADLPHGSPEERAAHTSRKARLDALLRFMTRANERFVAGEMSPGELFNLLQVTRDVVDAGTQLAVLPEEALCWERAGLDLALAHYRITEQRVKAGTMPSHALVQMGAAVEYFRAHYRRALARCIELQR